MADVMAVSRICALFLCCALVGQTASAAAAKDVRVTDDPTAQDVVAYAGQVAWIREDAANQFQLVLRTDTGTADLPVAPFAVLPTVTFGPGPSGHPTLVYPRSTGTGQQLYEFDTATGVEAPAPVPEASKGCKVSGAVNGQLVAYAFARLRSPCRDIVRVQSGARTLLTRRIPYAWSIALGSRHLAVMHGDVDVWLHAYSLTTKRGRLVMFEGEGGVGGAGSITAPVFDATDTLYFAATSINASGTYGSTLGPYRVRLTTHPTCAMSRRRFGANVLLRSLAIDPPNAFYTDDEQHMFQTPSAGLRFGRRSRLPC